MSSVSNDLLSMLECPVCFDTMDIPKVLPCGHTTCARCLNQMVGGNLVITCPTCRGQTYLQEQGVAGLPNNPTLMQIKDMLKLKGNTQAPDSQSSLESNIAESMDVASNILAVLHAREEKQKLYMEGVCNGIDEHVRHLQEVLQQKEQTLKCNFQDASKGYLHEICSESQRFTKIMQLLPTCKTMKEYEDLVSPALAISEEREFSLRFQPVEGIEVGSLESRDANISSGGFPEMAPKMAELALRTDTFHSTPGVNTIMPPVLGTGVATLGFRTETPQFNTPMHPITSTGMASFDFRVETPLAGIYFPDVVPKMIEIAKIIDKFHRKTVRSGIFQCNICLKPMKESCWLRCADQACVVYGKGEEFDVCNKCSLKGRHNQHINKLRIFRQPVGMEYCKNCGYEGAITTTRCSADEQARLLSSMTDLVTLCNDYEKTRAKHVMPNMSISCNECEGQVSATDQIFWLRCHQCNYDLCNRCSSLSKHAYHAEHIKLYKQTMAPIYCRACAHEPLPGKPELPYVCRNDYVDPMISSSNESKVKIYPKYL